MRAAVRARAAWLLVALSLVTPTTGCAASAATVSGDVTILVAWNGAELYAFRHSVIAGFNREYPQVNVTVDSTRGLTEELDGDIQQGDLPDLAALPSIGAIRLYASDGELTPLNGLVDTADYGAPWSALVRAGKSNQVFAVPVKADVKSLIWYDPAVFRQFHYSVPTTWPELLKLSETIEAAGRQPWCLPVSSPPTSGWPGTDWISDIMLSSYPPATYQDWVNGTLSWQSGPVKSAWQEWNQITNNGDAIYDHGEGALKTSIGTIHPSPSGCFLAHGTLVDEGITPGKNEKFGTDYSFFPFPPAAAGTAAAGATAGTPIQVSADFVGIFRKTPAAVALLKYMASTAAQIAWVGYLNPDGRSADNPDGLSADGFSADSQVPPSAYPDQVTRDIAAQLTSGRELCFGAADAMSPDESTAFDQAVRQDLAAPGQLTSTILPELSKVPPDAGGVPPVCGKPSPTTPGKRS